VVPVAHAVVGDDIGGVAGERVLDVERLARVLELLEAAAELVDEGLDGGFLAADARAGEEGVQLGAELAVQVVVDRVEEGQGGVEGLLVVFIFVAGAVARVEDFVVVGVIDVQLGRADADDGACMTLVQVGRQNVKPTRMNAKK
jgi:hypothetical protein